MNNSSLNNLSKGQEEDVQRIIDAYNRGCDKRIAYENEFHTDQEKQHEQNVKQNWSSAITDLFKKHVNTSSQMVSYNTTRTTFSLNMNSAGVGPSMEFLASHFDEKPDELMNRIKTCGNTAVENKKTKSQYSGLFILLGIFALVAIAQMKLTSQVAFFLCSLVFLALVLFFSRRVRLSNTLKPGNVNSLERYCDILNEGLFQSANKTLLAISLIAVVGSLAFLIISNRPPSLDQQIKTALVGTKYDGRLTADIDSIIMKNEKISEHGQQAFLSVYDSSRQGSFEKFWLSVYASQKTSAGFPQETAKDMLNQQLLELKYSSVDDIDKRDCLLTGLKNSTLGGNPETFTQVLQSYFSSGSKTDKETAAVLGKNVKGWSTDTGLSNKIDLYNMFRKNGFPAESFLGAALNNSDYPEFLAVIQQTEDLDLARTLASIYGKSCETLTDAIPLIYTMRGKGLSMEKLFPDGIEIQMALPLLNPEHLGDDYSDANISDYEKYIAISRTEKDEPYEEKKSENAIPNDYDGHDKNDPSVFTVKIESRITDRIPLEHLPSTEEECNVLIVSDMVFFLDGIIEQTTSKSNGYTSNVTSRNYIPSYGRLYRVLLVDRETGIPLLDYDYNVLEVEEFSSSTANSRNKYLPIADSKWATQTLDELLKELDEAEWSSTMMLLNIFLNNYLEMNDVTD